MDIFAPIVKEVDGNHIRVMNGQEFASWITALAAMKPEDDVNILYNALLVRTICDESGNRLFTDSDTITDRMPVTRIKSLFDASSDLNSITKKN